tara:strand:+ start:333 stop:518 length:186 start_codon:yes stop_codon:yes gene_type:complete
MFLQEVGDIFINNQLPKFKNFHSHQRGNMIILLKQDKFNASLKDITPNNIHRIQVSILFIV